MKQVGYYTCFLLCIKMSETTYYQKNRVKIILNRAKEYYKNNKELSEKENDMNKEYGRNRHKNMSEENKQRLPKEYQNNTERIPKRLS